MFIILILLLIVEVFSNQIFPIMDQFKVQLENDGWIDCQSKDTIQAITCSGDDLLWLECYKVPENGLCSRQNILLNTSETLTYSFAFYQPNFQNYDLEINNEKKTGLIEIQDNIGKATLQFSSTSSEIKINQKGAYFTGLTISQECIPNCKSCDKGFCTQCNDKYYLYNYNCQSDDCDLSIIDSNFITQADGSIQDGQYVVNIKYNFKITFCLIPKIYLTKGLKDSSIQLILDPNQIKYNIVSGSPESLQISLPLSQVQTNCEQFETTQTYFYQCYIGVALTNTKITQFLAILIGQIQIERSTESISQYTQSISLSESSNGLVGPVFVVSETINQDLNIDKKMLTVVQTILDPSFSNFQIKYKVAYIVQDEQNYNLKLDYQIQKGVTTTFGFSWGDLDFDPESEFKFYIQSLAEPATQRIRRRQLEVSLKREQLEVIYEVQNQNSFQQQSSLIDKQNSSIEIILVMMGILGLSIIIIISTICYNKFQQKKEKRSSENKQNV